MKFPILVLLALSGCSHDFIDLGDGDCGCECPTAEFDAEPADDAAPDSDVELDADGDVTTADDAEQLEDATADEEAEPDAFPEDEAPDVGPDTPEDDSGGEVDASAPDDSGCDPDDCIDTCFGYGYPGGTCDGIFCLCSDGAEDAGVEDATPAGEDCHNRRDDDGDGLADCRDPDCWRLIYCHCEPECSPELVCRAGVCSSYP